MKRIIRSNIGIFLFIIVLIIRFLFSFSEILFEGVYFNFLFPAIRSVQSALSFIWIIPGYWIFAILLLAWLIWRFPKSRNFKLFFKRLANLVSGTLAIFLFLWGFNYVDKGFAERSVLPESNELIDLSRHYISIMDTAMFYRSEIAGIDKLSSIVDLENLPTDSAINFWVKNVLENYNYPTNPEISVRRIKPTGTLRRLSIAGIYNPFTGEANVDNALPSLPLIFTTAHEIAHGYGVTSEAEANFVAYLACMQSGNPVGKYAAAYAIWRQIASEINKTYPPEDLKILASQIPQPLYDDRQAILQKYYRYKGYFPNVTDAINDTYLKLQGVQAGTEDYDGFLQLYFRLINAKDWE